MNLQECVAEKITAYEPKNGLDYIARFFIAMSAVKHSQVTNHIERVALLAEAIASRIRLDSKSAFFAGLLHDVGKLILPYNLFDGHDINQEEYQEIKQHAIIGFEALKNDYLFTSLCAGLHHAMYQHGYGLTMKDFPDCLSHPVTTKKILQIAVIVSISDFIEAYTHRKTKIRDGSNSVSQDLQSMLYLKYPDDLAIVDIALEEFPKLANWDEP